jgi:hypothetical protein
MEFNYLKTFQNVQISWVRRGILASDVNRGRKLLSTAQKGELFLLGVELPRRQYWANQGLEAKQVCLAEKEHGGRQPDGPTPADTKKDSQFWVTECGSQYRQAGLCGTFEKK